MSSSSPNESWSFKVITKAWAPADTFVVVLWLHIPAYVFLLRHTLLAGVSIYSHDLPSAAQYLVQRNVLVAISILSVAVLFAVLAIRGNDHRRRFIQMACFLGVLVHLVWAFFCFGPVLSLLHKLG